MLQELVSATYRLYLAFLSYLSLSGHMATRYTRFTTDTKYRVSWLYHTCGYYQLGITTGCRGGPLNRDESVRVIELTWPWTNTNKSPT